VSDTMKRFLLSLVTALIISTGSSGVAVYVSNAIHAFKIEHLEKDLARTNKRLERIENSIYVPKF